MERFKSIFDPSNSFYQFGKKIYYTVILNFLFMLTCIPIITIGASMTAMNDVITRIINEREVSTVKDYFRAFKQNFVKSTIVWIPALIILFIMYVDVYYWIHYETGVYGKVMLVASAIVILVYLMILHTVFPLIARFDMSVKEYVKNAVEITFRSPLLCLEAVAFTCAIIGFTIYMVLTASYMIFIYLVFFCFGLTGLIQGYVYRKVLNRYSEEYVEMVKRVMAEEEAGDEYDEF